MKPKRLMALLLCLLTLIGVIPFGGAFAAGSTVTFSGHAKSLYLAGQTVVLNGTVDGDAVLEDGLRAGDTVVTDGQLRLVPGAMVEIKAGPSDAGAVPGQPAGRAS